MERRKDLKVEKNVTGKTWKKPAKTDGVKKDNATDQTLGNANDQKSADPVDQTLGPVKVNTDSDGKTESNVTEEKTMVKKVKETVVVEDEALLNEYMAFEAAARTRGSGVTGFSNVARSTIEEILKAIGKDEVEFAFVSGVVSKKVGKKAYNQLRSVVTAKTSAYELVNNEKGHVVIRKKTA